jgi:hypothetical protein
MKLNLKTLSAAVVLLPLALLIMFASCSGTSDAGDNSSSEDTATPAILSPDPAFDPLLPTLPRMTTAPIMLPASLPPKVGDVAIEQDPNEGNPYNAGGGKYTILFLYSNPDPGQIVRPYAFICRKRM